MWQLEVIWVEKSNFDMASGFPVYSLAVWIFFQGKWRAGHLYYWSDWSFTLLCSCKVCLAVLYFTVQIAAPLFLHLTYGFVPHGVCHLSQCVTIAGTENKKITQTRDLLQFPKGPGGADSKVSAKQQWVETSVVVCNLQTWEQRQEKCL